MDIVTKVAKELTAFLYLGLRKAFEGYLRQVADICMGIDKENAKKLTAEVVAALPNTPYAVFGKRWLDKPETMAKSKITCSSCHDAGRLQAKLDRLAR